MENSPDAEFRSAKQLNQVEPQKESIIANEDISIGEDDILKRPSTTLLMNTVGMPVDQHLLEESLSKIVMLDCSKGQEAWYHTKCLEKCMQKKF